MEQHAGDHIECLEHTLALVGRGDPDSAAGIALFVRSQLAVWLFALSLALILVNNVYDLTVGSALGLADGVKVRPSRSFS